MRNHLRIFLYVFLPVTFFAVMTGCRSASTDSGRWLTPEVRGQAPAWNGNINPDAFSSSQVVAVPETPIPAVQPFPAQPPNTLPANTLPPNTLPTNALPATVSAIPPVNNPNDPWMPKVAATPQTLPTVQEHSVQEHPWNLPTVPAHAEQIPTFAVTPTHSVSPITDPWGFDNPNDIRNAVSIEEQAKREEDEIEKLRLAELATAQRKDGTPEYLQPLPKWNGPFETRDAQQTIEQDIIRQVGYSEEKAKSFDNLPVYDWEKEEQKGFDWSVLDPVNFFTKIRDWVGLGPDETKANIAMKKGREILLSTPDLKDRKKCLEAAKLFSEAAKRYPDSLLEEDALHLAGECYFFGEDYTRAVRSYQKLLIKYQHSKHIDNGVRRLFVIARYWEQEDRRGVSSINITEKSRPTFDTFGYAKKAYETIFINDPNGPISDDAVMALATAYLRKGRYEGDDNYNHAAFYYNFLRENYP
ncbi:MAG: tetratricopeptide repeat protein, partial [Planctomycetaceae bacterium]|nr:tetratricopeptide repeat protein [Planctomycetaceae bacterium]